MGAAACMRVRARQSVSRCAVARSERTADQRREAAIDNLEDFPQAKDKCEIVKSCEVMPQWSQIPASFGNCARKAATKPVR